MKKILLSALAVFTLSFGYAQEEDQSSIGGFDKGDVVISGNVGFGSESTGDVKSNDLAFAPRVAYFVTQNIATGVKLGVGSSKAENGVADTKDATSLSAGLFGRYFFTPAKKFSLFGELGFDYVTENDKLADVKNNGFDLGVGPGICYFVSEHLAIDAGWGALGYSTRKADTTGAEATNKVGFNLNLTDINFGLVYKF